MVSGIAAVSTMTALSLVPLHASAGDVVARVSGKRLASTDGGGSDATGARSGATTNTREASTGVDASTAPETVGGCSGVVVPAGSSIQAAIDARPAGTTLCLEAGHYGASTTIKPKNGMSLVGAGKDATFITTSSAPTVIDLRGRENILLQGFDVSGAVGSLACKPGCGRGIRAGINTIIDDVRAHHNALVGIGGTGPNLLVRNTELNNNGRSEFIGCCAGGVKTGKGFRIENSYVHDNVGIGIWCDVGCRYGSFEVYGNTVEGNTVGGIRYEVSASPAVISGNTVRGNNTMAKGGHGGIEINSSQNATVIDNVVGGNQRAGIVANGGRAPGLANVTINNNALNGDKLVGCGGSIVCTGNS
jgi:hypothetical protein